jgi:hypothetical protein
MHELAHTVQQGLGSGAGSANSVSLPGDSVEKEADNAADAFKRGEPAPAISPRQKVQISRQPEGDPDDVAASPQGPENREVVLEPLDWNPEVNPEDPAILSVPLSTTREQIALRLYADSNHFGGFDLIDENHVRLRSLEGVAIEVATLMRIAFEKRLAEDVEKVIDILKQRLILGGDEWKLLDTTVWWSARSDLTDAQNRSYFDRYLDALASHELTEERFILSDITHTALDWLLDEAEEKAPAINQLIAKRSTRNHFGSFDLRGSGPLAAGDSVGSYAYRKKRPKLAIGEWDYLIGEIRVKERILDESSSARAEIALRNSSERGPRVMVPGGDGHFYGYTIKFARLESDYTDPAEHWYGQEPEHIDDWWWHYSGMIVIQGDEFNPNFGAGGEAEHSQRAEILTRALTGGADAQRGLDFDALSLTTIDQRMTLIEAAIKRHEDSDASLIARLLYTTASADFPILERRMSKEGTAARLARMPDPAGRLASIGRIFTVKSMESMQVAGENLENLPEFVAGFDEDGYFQGADWKTSQKTSATAPDANFASGGQVALGHEPTLPGEASGPLMRDTITIQPRIIRIGSLPGMMWRKAWGTLGEDTGEEVGPLLPTQLVRVTILGKPPQTRVVTTLEAIGLLNPPSGEIVQRALSATVHGYMWIMAGSGLLRAFGPALAEGLIEEGGLRAFGSAMLETAGTTAGRDAIVNAALIAGMETVDKNRDALSETPEGRAFLEIYDVAMAVWMAHDLQRLITSGLVPRLVAAADRVIALPGAIRESVMGVRAEAEAMIRAIKRFPTPQEAAAAVLIDGPAAAADAVSAKSPGFLAMLRVTRGEVAAERLTESIAGTSLAPTGKRVLGRLESALNAAEEEVEAATDKASTNEANRRAKSVADARLAIAQRAMQLRPDAREAFLNAVDGVIATRPNSVGSLTDLLAAAAESRAPNTFITEVQKLASRKGLSAETLRVLGSKVRQGAKVLDLAWLNRTSISDEALEFLGNDKRTPWDLYRRAATNPGDAAVMRDFRTKARGAGGEMVGEVEAERLGADVERQVKMDSSEIDFAFKIGGKRFGFEIKGWTVDTWKEALEAGYQKLNRRALTETQRDAVRKIDKMLEQLKNAKSATGRNPYLGVTDDLMKNSNKTLLDRLKIILDRNGLDSTKIIPLSESQIKEAAAGTIGEALGVTRP